MQRVPHATKLLARLLKVESVLLSKAAEPLFQCMVRLLPSCCGRLQPEREGKGCSEEEAMLRALQRRSEEWASERLHAVVRGTRTDQRHPLHSASSGCLDLLQEWLYDSGMSHNDVQDAVAEEALGALRETLRTPLQPAALECLPALADMLSQASRHSQSSRMTAAAEDMLAVWANCSAARSTGAGMLVRASQPSELPRDVRADIEALMFASSDAYLERRVAEAVEQVTDEQTLNPTAVLNP